MRWPIVIGLLFAVAMSAAAQTETPTPTPTATATLEPYVYATILPQDGTPPGQTTRFDYVTTAGEVHIANLLTLDVISDWGQFLFTVIFVSALARRRK
jgi:hypothetical protein